MEKDCGTLPLAASYNPTPRIQLSVRPSVCLSLFFTAFVYDAVLMNIIIHVRCGHYHNDYHHQLCTL